MVLGLVKHTIESVVTLGLQPNGILFYYTSDETDDNDISDTETSASPQLNLAIFMILFIICSIEVIFLKVMSSLTIRSYLNINNQSNDSRQFQSSNNNNAVISGTVVSTTRNVTSAPEV